MSLLLVGLLLPAALASGGHSCVRCCVATLRLLLMQLAGQQLLPVGSHSCFSAAVFMAGASLLHRTSLQMPFVLSMWASSFAQC